MACYPVLSKWYVSFLKRLQYASGASLMIFTGKLYAWATTTGWVSSINFGIQIEVKLSELQKLVSSIGEFNLTFSFT